MYLIDQIRFINARRRILQPLLDGAAAISSLEPSSQSDSTIGQKASGAGAKKRNHAGRIGSVSRYWSNGESSEIGEKNGTVEDEGPKRNRLSDSDEEMTVDTRKKNK